MNKKITILAGAISCALSGAAFADISDIVITEYVEGSSYNKAVEITNVGSTDHTFNGSYGLFYSKYKNRINNAVGENVLLNVTVPAGQSIVVINPDASDALKASITANASTAVESTGSGYNSAGFNGDDAVWIAQATDADAIHDIMGTVSHSGDKVWADRTLRRIIGSTATGIYDATQWSTETIDTFDGLGNPEFAPAPPLPTPCSDSRSANENLAEPTIGAVQGEGYSSPLIDSGFESADQYLVTGVVSSVATSLVKGFFLYDNNADSNVKTSDGVFVKTEAPVSADMVGKEVCVLAKVIEDYGVTSLEPEGDVWEIVNDIPAVPTPVNLVRIDSDDVTFRSTLERYEGMPVKLVQDMDATEDGEQNMRVSRTFGFDYDSYRNNMVLAYKRPNSQPNQDHVAGSEESQSQSQENKDYRIYLDSDEKAANGKIPYYPDFSKSNYVRIDDSVVGLEGVLHYSFNEFRLIPTNTVTGSAFIHNTDRKSKPSITESYGDDGFTIKVATQNVLNYFNSPYGGSDNNFGDNRGAESQQEFERQQAKIVEAVYGLDADIVGLMEVENNGFGDFSAIIELLEAINEKYYDEDYGDRNNQNSIHNRYVFVGFDKNGDQILDDQDTVGSDAITTGIIYRPSKVSVVSGKVIPMPEQHAPMVVDASGAAIVDKKGEVRESGDNYQRNTVAATFKVHNTGKQLTVAVNHLKSKGSTCAEDWVGWETWKGFDPVSGDVNNNDYQGSCENFRVAAAVHLGEEMAKIGGDQVVLGDMNSYAHEDPMLVLTSNPTGKEIYAAAYTYLGKAPQFAGQAIDALKPISQTFGYLNAVDLKTAEGETSWSYSYNDEVGSLDHLLITKSLEDRLVDAVDWHINAPESSLYDYNNKYKGGDENEPNPFYEESAYRSSDHDPALISLGYKYGEDGMNIAVKSSRADVPYAINIMQSELPSNFNDLTADEKAEITAKRDAELPKEDDVAELTISPMPEGVALPKVKLEKDGNQTVMFDVVGLPAGEFTFVMKLTRTEMVRAAGDVTVIDSKSIAVTVEKRDSSNVKPTTPSYDGSGGAFGFSALLSLLGFGFLRRRRN